MSRTALLSLLILSSGTNAFSQEYDLCGDAPVDALPVGGTLVYNGDNSTATFDGDFVPGSGLAALNVPSTWRAFVTTECADIRIDYCGSASVFIDFWNILATTCPAGNLYISTQQYNYAACGDGNPTMYFPNVTPGTYYYPIWYDAVDASGPYTITIEALACGSNTAPNDACASVVPEPLNAGSQVTFTGDNTFATSSGDFAAGTPFVAAPVVWHGFTLSECTKVTLDYCGLSPIWGNTLGVLTRDCPGSDLVYSSSFNTTDCGDGNRTYIYNALEAGTYYVPVLLHTGSNSVGAYTITLTGEACPPPTSAQDLCVNVQMQPLVVGGSIDFTGDNTNATGADDFPVGSGFSGAPTVWHGITTTTCTRLTVAYCGLAPAWGNTFGFLARDCPASDLVYYSNSNNTDCGDGNITYVFSNLPAGDYLIPVVRDALNNAIGPYSIQVSAASCPAVPPANDNCANVTPSLLAVGATIDLVGDNTNATSTGDFVAGSPFAAAPVTWHAFTTDACMDLLVGYCGIDPAWPNTLGVLATTCPGDALIYFTTTIGTCGDGNTTYLFNDLPPGTYYLPVLRDVGNNSFGPYTISLTAEDCLFLGVHAAQQASEVRVYPNPSDGRLLVTGAVPGEELRVLDAFGRIVLLTRANGSGQQDLDLRHVATGSYSVVLGGTRASRFVIR